MKNLKKLTYNERKIVESWGLNPETWKREKLIGQYILLVNDFAKEHRLVPAYVKGR
jgi:hypothetical protein